MTFYSVGFLIVLSQIILSLALSYILKIKWEEKPYTVFFFFTYLRAKPRNLSSLLFNRTPCEG